MSPSGSPTSPVGAEFFGQSDATDSSSGPIDLPPAYNVDSFMRESSTTQDLYPDDLSLSYGDMDTDNMDLEEASSFTGLGMDLESEEQKASEAQHVRRAVNLTHPQTKAKLRAKCREILAIVSSMDTNGTSTNVEDKVFKILIKSASLVLQSEEEDSV